MGDRPEPRQAWASKPIPVVMLPLSFVADRDTRLNGCERKVLEVLCHLIPAPDPDSTIPASAAITNQQIVLEAGYSERAVIKALHKLEALGFIKRDRGTSHSPSQYRLRVRRPETSRIPAFRAQLPDRPESMVWPKKDIERIADIPDFHVQPVSAARKTEPTIPLVEVPTEPATVGLASSRSPIAPGAGAIDENTASAEAAAPPIQQSPILLTDSQREANRAIPERRVERAIRVEKAAVPGKAT